MNFGSGRPQARGQMRLRLRHILLHHARGNREPARHFRRADTGLPTAFKNSAAAGRQLLECVSKSPLEIGAVSCLFLIRRRGEFCFVYRVKWDHALAQSPPAIREQVRGNSEQISVACSNLFTALPLVKPQQGFLHDIVGFVRRVQTLAHVAVQHALIVLNSPRVIPHAGEMTVHPRERPMLKPNDLFRFCIRAQTRAQSRAELV